MFLIPPLRSGEVYETVPDRWATYDFFVFLMYRLRLTSRPVVSCMNPVGIVVTK